MSARKRSWIVSSFLALLILISCNSFRKADIKIMTFNILYNSHKVFSGNTSWEIRHPIMIDCLKNHTPEMLGTQESFEFQTDSIIKAFPQWSVFGKGRYHNVPAVNPNRPYEDMGGESCRILFDTTRFVLLDEGTFWHSDYPDSAGSRTWGKFQIKNSNTKFVVMNTHFHWGEPYVENTARLIMKKWREIAARLPTILMGDFNLDPASETHKLFCGEIAAANIRGNFIDCWQALKKPEIDAGTSNDFNGTKSKTRIDWILVTPEFKVNTIDIIYDNENGIYPSDHYPVMAELTLDEI